MKAITLWQPWASLIAAEQKGFETRSWATTYRGPLAIHAAKRPTRQCIRGLSMVQITSLLRLFGYDARYPVAKALKELDQYCGKVLCTVNLIGCHRIVRYGGRGMRSTDPGWLDFEDGIFEPDEQEILCGDWTPGRYAWELAAVKQLEIPMPAIGKQGFWSWEAHHD